MLELEIMISLSFHTVKNMTKMTMWWLPKLNENKVH